MFRKYSSIENSYQSNFVEKIKLNIPVGTKYIAREKIHGANFSVIFDKDLTFKVASRNGIIDSGFNWQKVFITDGIIDNLKLAAEDVFSNEKYKNAERVQFFGEIFGGSYKGKTDKNNSKIQKGVDYAPFNSWLMFDIGILSQGEKNEQCLDGVYIKYLSESETINLSEKYLIKMAPLVGVYDTLNEAISFDVEKFESIVYKLFNLEKVENNIAEGIVIKPLDGDYRLPTGDRPIIKQKTEAFKEKGHKKSEYVPVVLDEEVKNLLLDTTAYLTENRVESAKSKFSEDENNVGKIIGEFSKDVYDTVNNELSDKILSLKTENKPVFKKELSKLSINYVKSVILKTR